MEVIDIFRKVRDAVDGLGGSASAQTRRDAVEAVAKMEGLERPEDRREYGRYGLEVLQSWREGSSYRDLANLTTAVLSVHSSSSGRVSALALGYIEKNVGSHLDSQQWQEVEVTIDQVVRYYSETADTRDFYPLVSCVKHAKAFKIWIKTKMIVEIMRRRSRNDTGGGMRIEEAIDVLFQGCQGSANEASFRDASQQLVNAFGLEDWAEWLPALDYPTNRAAEVSQQRRGFLGTCFDKSEPLLLVPTIEDGMNPAQAVIWPKSLAHLVRHDQVKEALELDGKKLKSNGNNQSFDDTLFLEHTAIKRSRDWIVRRLNANLTDGPGGSTIVRFVPRGEPR